MKLPMWFKIAWWVVLTGLLTYFLYLRTPDLAAGRASLFDGLVVVLWFGLLLTPIFNEVTIWGVTLKQQIETLKNDVSSEISALKNEIRNTIDVRTNIAPNIYFPTPPRDSELPALEEYIRAIVKATQRDQGIESPLPSTEELSLSPDTQLMFAARYNIEQQLRRLARRRLLEDTKRIPSWRQLTNDLVSGGVINSSLALALREIYAVCTQAIHGESITRAQVDFVKEVAPDLIATLKGIE